ncbi:MAG TPA: NAD-dependent alcohol dehydrogenase [Clostridiales bacterium]|nr:NAD-dependent alcohol dehydrogenase [Clostridiales bacterium]
MDKIIEVLEQGSISYIIFDRVEPDPSTDTIEDIYMMAKESNADAFIAVGGGSSIDSSKGASLLMSNPGKLHDYAGVNMVKNKGIPIIAVPTTAGTGSEVTIFAVLSDNKTNTKFTVTSNLIAPNIAVLDPELTLTLPSKLTASTGLDAMTHAIEAYTSLISDPIADTMALEAMSLLYKFLPIAVNNGSDIVARVNVMQASLLAGMAFNNAFLGLCHAIASPLGALFHVPHGTANAVMLPYVMKFNYITAPEKFINMAKAFGVKLIGNDIYENAYCAVEAIKKLVLLCELPTTLREVGANEELLEQVAKDSLLSVQLRFNCRKACEEQIRTIVREAF